MAMKLVLVVGVLGTALSVGAGALVWRFGYYAAPLAWTGEPQRLAAALAVTAGSSVADIGAGGGAMAEAMARMVGERGLVYATELSSAQRDDIARRVAGARLDNVRVIAAGAVDTGLPPQCCDAVYMRTVFHHLSDRTAFAASVRGAVRPGGRIAVIDFAPGTLWFHGADHGVTPDQVRAAFWEAGWRLREQVDDWGGGMFLQVFEGTGNREQGTGRNACC
jgi:cyclopropane fatty-acyl-phospholipid synthase-like methyltransferase